MKVTIKCDIQDRWLPHFLGMLKTMQTLGSFGSSRIVGLYSDGDGDFRPTFIVNGKNIKDIKNVAKPIYNDDSEKAAICDYFYDAG